MTLAKEIVAALFLLRRRIARALLREDDVLLFHSDGEAFPVPAGDTRAGE